MIDSLPDGQGAVVKSQWNAGPTEDQIRRTLQEAEQALSCYATAAGRAAFPVSAHLVTAQTAAKH